MGAAAIIFVVFLLYAQFLPQATQEHTITLLTTAPDQCVSIPDVLGDDIVLSRRELEHMVQRRSLPGERVQRAMKIYAHDAQKLLAQVSGRLDPRGCDIIERPLPDNLGRSPAYVQGARAIFAIFEQGHGRVWDNSKQSWLTSVVEVAHDVDCHYGPSGGRTVYTPDGIELLWITTCFVEPQASE